MTRRRFPYLAPLVLCSAVLLQAQERTVAPQPTEIAGAVSRVYKSVDGSELRLHIFNPPAHATATSLPAIVFFFGGVWTTGSINQFTPQARHFASRGLIAIVADYRVYGRHKTSPFEAIADAKSAIRWVRSHARELKIDVNRIAAGGGSAGGHLAAATAVIDRFEEKGEDQSVSSKPNALVLFNPAIDTGPKSATASGISGGNLTARFGDRGEEGSPFHHLGRNLPPTLILHGRADVSVPYSDVERFCEAATKLGNKCQLVGYEGAPHGFFNNKWREETMLEADRFLVALGYLKNASPAVKDADPE